MREPGARGSDSEWVYLDMNTRWTSPMTRPRYQGSKGSRSGGRTFVGHVTCDCVSILRLRSLGGSLNSSVPLMIIVREGGAEEDNLSWIYPNWHPFATFTVSESFDRDN